MTTELLIGAAKEIALLPRRRGRYSLGAVLAGFTLLAAQLPAWPTAAWLPEWVAAAAPLQWLDATVLAAEALPAPPRSSAPS